MKAWIVRAGAQQRSTGRLRTASLAEGSTNVPDLSHCPPGRVKAAVAASFPGDVPRRISNFAGQLWARTGDRPTDLEVLALKTTKMIAIGICTSGYQANSTGRPNTWTRADAMAYGRNRRSERRSARCGDRRCASFPDDRTFTTGTGSTPSAPARYSACARSC